MSTTRDAVERRAKLERDIRRRHHITTTPNDAFWARELDDIVRIKLAADDGKYRREFVTPDMARNAVENRRKLLELRQTMIDLETKWIRDPNSIASPKDRERAEANHMAGRLYGSPVPSRDMERYRMLERLVVMQSDPLHDAITTAIRESWPNDAAMGPIILGAHNGQCRRLDELHIAARNIAAQSLKGTVFNSLDMPEEEPTATTTAQAKEPLASSAVPLGQNPKWNDTLKLKGQKSSITPSNVMSTWRPPALSAGLDSNTRLFWIRKQNAEERNMWLCELFVRYQARERSSPNNGHSSLDISVVRAVDDARANIDETKFCEITGLAPRPKAVQAPELDSSPFGWQRPYEPELTLIRQENARGEIVTKTTSRIPRFTQYPFNFYKRAALGGSESALYRYAFQMVHHIYDTRIDAIKDVRQKSILWNELATVMHLARNEKSFLVTHDVAEEALCLQMGSDGIPAKRFDALFFTDKDDDNPAPFLMKSDAFIDDARYTGSLRPALAQHSWNFHQFAGRIKAAFIVPTEGGFAGSLGWNVAGNLALQGMTACVAPLIRDTWKFVWSVSGMWTDLGSTGRFLEGVVISLAVHMALTWTIRGLFSAGPVAIWKREASTALDKMYAGFFTVAASASGAYYWIKDKFPLKREHYPDSRSPQQQQNTTQATPEQVPEHSAIPSEPFCLPPGVVPRSADVAETSARDLDFMAAVGSDKMWLNGAGSPLPSWAAVFRIQLMRRVADIAAMVEREGKRIETHANARIAAVIQNPEQHADVKNALGSLMSSDASTLYKYFAKAIPAYAAPTRGPLDWLKSMNPLQSAPTPQQNAALLYHFMPPDIVAQMQRARDFVEFGNTTLCVDHPSLKWINASSTMDHPFDPSRDYWNRDTLNLGVTPEGERKLLGDRDQVILNWGPLIMAMPPSPIPPPPDILLPNNTSRVPSFAPPAPVPPPQSKPEDAPAPSPLLGAYGVARVEWIKSEPGTVARVIGALYAYEGGPGYVLYNSLNRINYIAPVLDAVRLMVQERGGTGADDMLGPFTAPIDALARNIAGESQWLASQVLEADAWTGLIAMGIGGNDWFVHILAATARAVLKTAVTRFDPVNLRMQYLLAEAKTQGTGKTPLWRLSGLVVLAGIQRLVTTLGVFAFHVPLFRETALSKVFWDVMHQLASALSNEVVVKFADKIYLGDALSWTQSAAPFVLGGSLLAGLWWLSGRFLADWFFGIRSGVRGMVQLMLPAPAAMRAMVTLKNLLVWAARTGAAPLTRIDFNTPDSRAPTSIPMPSPWKFLSLIMTDEQQQTLDGIQSTTLAMVDEPADNRFEARGLVRFVDQTKKGGAAAAKTSVRFAGPVAPPQSPMELSPVPQGDAQSQWRRLWLASTEVPPPRILRSWGVDNNTGAQLAAEVDDASMALAVAMERAPAITTHRGQVFY